VQNEEQRLVRGVVMRADFPIYRRDAADREYYVIYHADTIRQMAEKYLAESRQNNVDRNHDGNEIPGVQMVQYFIKDTSAGIAPEGFDEIADGSLFAEFHVTDDEVWAAIKAGIFMGFSLEGLFDFQPETSQEDVDAIVDELDRLGETFANETDNQSKQYIMSKIERTLARLRELLEADKPKTTEEPTEIKCGSVTTDKGPLSWDGDDDLEAGYNVYVIAEDGTRTPAPEGEYVTGDNKTIVVVDGKVAEIRDPEAEVAPQNEEEQTEKVTEEVAAEEQAPEAEPDYKAMYEEAQARIAELEAQVAELMQANEDTLAAQATIEEELNASRQEVAALKATPAAKPAHEEVKAAAEAVKTGNKGIDRLASLMGR
jgi:hypothetical protein